MNELLIYALLGVDFVLIGVLFFRDRKPSKPVTTQLLKELHEEKTVLKELHANIREELGQQLKKARDVYDKVSRIATECEMEMGSSKKVLTTEIQAVFDEYAERVEGYVNELGKHRSSLSALNQKSQRERQLLGKAISRGEKLAMFFNRKVPYEEVLEEIEDKKYTDARHLLSKGMSVSDVAIEVGLAESEVKLLASVV